MNVPEDLRYSEDHEWARAEGERIRVGITDFAQSALGDIVFVSLPEVDAVLELGQQIGEVESTKSVSELYAPVAGRIVEVNASLVEDPEKLNTDPYGEGWVCVIEPASTGSLDGLLDAAHYRELTVT